MPPTLERVCYYFLPLLGHRLPSALAPKKNQAKEEDEEEDEETAVFASIEGPSGTGVGGLGGGAHDSASVTSPGYEARRASFLDDVGPLMGNDVLLAALGRYLDRHFG